MIVHYLVRQNGTEKSDAAKAVAMAEDQSVVIVGDRSPYPGFLAAKLDVDGSLLWQWEVRHTLSWCSCRKWLINGLSISAISGDRYIVCLIALHVRGPPTLGILGSDLFAGDSSYASSLVLC